MSILLKIIIIKWVANLSYSQKPSYLYLVNILIVDIKLVSLGHDTHQLTRWSTVKRKPVWDVINYIFSDVSNFFFLNFLLKKA